MRDDLCRNASNSHPPRNILYDYCARTNCYAITNVHTFNDAHRRTYINIVSNVGCMEEAATYSCVLENVYIISNNSTCIYNTWTTMFNPKSIANLCWPKYFNMVFMPFMTSNYSCRNANYWITAFG